MAQPAHARPFCHAAAAGAVDGTNFKALHDDLRRSLAPRYVGTPLEYRKRKPFILTTSNT